MKPRANVFFHGDVGCGRTSLIRSIQNQSPRAAPYPRQDLAVSTWEPSESDWYNIVGSEGPRYDQSLDIRCWDLSGHQTLRPIQALLLTPESLHVQVVDATRLDPASVVEVWNQIHFRVPGSAVILVMTKTDRLVLDIDGFESLQVRILEALQRNECQQKGVAQHWVQHISTLSAGERYTSHVKGLLNKRPQVPTSILQVSCKSAKGIRELSRVILTSLLDAQKFPCLRLRARLSEDGVPLEDMLEGYREGPETLTSLRGLEEFLSPLTPNESLENMIKLLHNTGAIIDFRDITSDKKDGGHLVCVDPEVFGIVVTSIHVADVKKTFRIEAGQFWPKQTGFKRPSPNLLSKVLERIPCKGLIRESLFPILWQDLELNEDQVLLYIDLLERLGVVGKHLPTLSDCEGLVMPDFPNLSVNKQYLAITMDMLPDKKPSLNWTSRPISGDLQLGWRYSFPLGAPLSISKMVMACCQKCCQDNQTYLYQWKNGLLMRLQQGIVCIAHERDCVTITCRADANEAGGNREAVQLLWRLLHPLIEVSSRLLHAHPGLIYRLLLVPDGEAFFVNSTNDVLEEVTLPLEDSYTEWQTTDVLSGHCKGQTVKVHGDILFPFKECKSRTYTLDDWLEIVITKGVESLQTDPSLPNGVTFTRHSSFFRGSRRRKRNSSKKRMELTWRLENDHHSQKTDPASDRQQNGSTDQYVQQKTKSLAPGQIFRGESEKGGPLPPPSSSADDNINKTASSIMPQESSNTTGGCSVSLMDETSESCSNGFRSRKVQTSAAAKGEMNGGPDCKTKVPTSMSEETMKQAASVFTSTVLARGLLQYIEEERSTNPKWKGAVSHKQILAARRVATLPNTNSEQQNSSLYHVAQAVIDAINNAAHHEPPRHSRTVKSNKSFLCSVL